MHRQALHTPCCALHLYAPLALSTCHDAAAFVRDERAAPARPEPGGGRAQVGVLLLFCLPASTVVGGVASAEMVSSLTSFLSTLLSCPPPSSSFRPFPLILLSSVRIPCARRAFHLSFLDTGLRGAWMGLATYGALKAVINLSQLPALTASLELRHQ